MRISLIIAAGGSGKRFGKRDVTGSASFTTKLFYPLLGRPVFAHTLEAFQTVPEIHEIIVAAHPRIISELSKLIKSFPKQVRIVKGGATRAESVWKALQKSNPKNEWIMVHDGARPLIEKKMISNLLKAANKKSAGGYILAKKVVPTLKRVEENFQIEGTVDRNFIYEAETPQLVKRKYLFEAYQNVRRGGVTPPGSGSGRGNLAPTFETTDEASLLESIDVPVRVVNHNGWNPKITTMEDLRLAEAYMAGNDRVDIKTGFGYDIHRLIPGRKFYLGGIHLPFAVGPLGHSDGDVLLHAIIDAVLGAMGAGDIGDWFSDKNPKFKNVKSMKFLEAVLVEARKKNFKILHVDTVIILERPKLGDYKNKIKIHLAKVLRLDPKSVSIKAKTHEGVGLEGSGQAVSCYAVVTLGEEK